MKRVGKEQKVAKVWYAQERRTAQKKGKKKATTIQPMIVRPGTKGMFALLFFFKGLYLPKTPLFHSFFSVYFKHLAIQRYLTHSFLSYLLNRSLAFDNLVAVEKKSSFADWHVVCSCYLGHQVLLFLEHKMHTRVNLTSPKLRACGGHTGVQTRRTHKAGTQPQ